MQAHGYPTPGHFRTRICWSVLRIGSAPVGCWSENGYAALHGETTPEPVLRRSECDDAFRHPVRNILVELHWSVTPPWFSFPLATEQLFARKVPVALGEFTVQAPAVEDAILLLCLNGLKDGWSRLETLVLIAELIRRTPQLKWAELQGRAESVRGQRMLNLGLLLARNMLKVTLPPDVEQRLDGDGKSLVLAGQLRDRLFRSPAEVPGTIERTLMLLRSREHLGDRLRCCLLRLTTPTRKDAAAIRLPGPLWAGYYLVRPIRLLGLVVGAAISRGQG